MSSPAPSPADRVSTPVDGVDVLGALSPSRAGDFMTCPLMYRFRTIDKLPEQPSPDALRGTVVHKVLEDLFDLPAADRTPDVAADMLVPSWEALLEAAPEIAEMFGDEGPDVASWLTSCREVLDRYFTLEDPRRLEPAERELYVETVLDSKLLLRGFVDRLDVAPDGRVRVVDYKGLALDTRLPTPKGWSTMGEIAVGDDVFGTDGRPTRVLIKSQVHERPCYRVTFLDGSSVVCDNVHLWSVVTSHRQRATSSVLDADALHARHRELVAAGRRHSMWVEAGGALESNEPVDLPIDPWVLGAWLGDGDCRGGRITVGHQDADDMLALLKEHWPRAVLVRPEATAMSMTLSAFDDRCTFGHDEFRPPTPGHDSRRCARESLHRSMTPWNVPLSTELALAGLRYNKHIPAAYLRASHDQRLAAPPGAHGHGRLVEQDQTPCGFHHDGRHAGGRCDRAAPHARDAPDALPEALRKRGSPGPHMARHRVHPCRREPVLTASESAGLRRCRHVTAGNAGAATDHLVDRASRRASQLSASQWTPPIRCTCAAQASSPPTTPDEALGVGFEAKALFQMKFYALVVWRTRGVLPSVLQLVYLGNGEILRYEPDEADLHATERKVEAVWRAIRECEETGDWQPSPSRLCDWCSYKPFCPSYGGTPPPLPERVPVPDPSGDVDTDEGLTAR